MEKKIETKFINKPDLSVLDKYFYDLIFKSIANLKNKTKSRN